MKYWIDTEFIEDGKTIDLISIGIVAEDCREFYREVDFPEHKASEWVRENVLPSLSHYNHRGHVTWDDYPSCPATSKALLAQSIVDFCNPSKYGKPEFWGYYADYDWVVFCQLFGKMIDLPKDWPMYCKDIKQLCDSLGNSKLPDIGKDEHHALADARWNKLAYEFLVGVSVK